MSGLYQIFLSGMSSHDRPIGTMLFLGPNGSDKTRAKQRLRTLFDEMEKVPDTLRELLLGILNKAYTDPR